MFLPIIILSISFVSLATVFLTKLRKRANFSNAYERFARVMPGVAWASLLLGLFFFPLGHVY
jgi:hypothetical protein